MSRWWPEHATLWLAPAKAGQALACAARELDQRALPPRTRLTCVLGGPLVRHRIVPWSDALSTPAQRQVLAASCFLDAYGDAARAWTVREHGAGQGMRFGAATLACAVDTAVLDGLAALASARRLRLTSVQPSLMQAHNRVRHRLAGGVYWFVWVEGPLTTLVLWAHGEPLQLKTLPSGAAPLGPVLDREWFLAGMEGAHCPVYRVRAQADGAAVASAAGWQVEDLPAPDAVGTPGPYPVAELLAA